MEQLHFRVVRKEQWLHMEENKLNVSVFSVEIKSENKQVMFIVARKNRDSKIPSLLVYRLKDFPQTNLITLDIFSRLSCRDSSFTVLPVSWCSATAAVNLSGPKCAFLHRNAIPSGQRASKFQSHSPQPFLLSLEEEEGTAPLVGLWWDLVFQVSRWGVWCYTVLQRHEQLREDGIPYNQYNQVAQNPQNRPSVTLPGESHCRETNPGLK